MRCHVCRREDATCVDVTMEYDTNGCAVCISERRSMRAVVEAARAWLDAAAQSDWGAANSIAFLRLEGLRAALDGEPMPITLQSRFGETDV